MTQTVLVTGTNRGIGLEFVRQLKARGDRVIATVRRTLEGSELGRLADRVVELDVSSDRSIAGLGRDLADEAIDVLINNAGVASQGESIRELTGPELERVLRINAIGPVLVAQSVLDNLARGRRKVIFSISSQRGSITNNDGGSTYGYRASKAALNQFNRSLAVELRPEGFTCVVVHPGWVQTEMGGPNAILTPQESVRGMLRILDALTPADTGRFFDYTGKELPW